jgi:hypothetical protein
MTSLMTIAKTGALLLMGFTAMVTAPATSASAQPKGVFCRNYADVSVVQQVRNRRLGCGYFGPRWTTFWQGHYNWCMLAPRGTSRGEMRVRRRRIVACGG